MSWRDLLNNPPALQLVSDFSTGPLTDRAPRLHWRFASDGSDLTTLLSGNPGWRSRAERIVQALGDTEGVQITKGEPGIPCFEAWGGMAARFAYRPWRGAVFGWERLNPTACAGDGGLAQLCSGTFPNTHWIDPVFLFNV